MLDRRKREEIIGDLRRRGPDLQSCAILVRIGFDSVSQDEAKRKICQMVRKLGFKRYIFCLQKDVDNFIAGKADLYISCNYLPDMFVSPKEAKSLIKLVNTLIGFSTRDYEWPESEHGKLKCKIRIFK